MTEQALRKHVLPLLVDPLGPIDPAAASELDSDELLLLHLLRTAQTEAAAPPAPDLVAMEGWLRQEVDDEAVADEVAGSLAAAELLEGLLETMQDVPADRLAAAPSAVPPSIPWPAHYTGAGWLATLGIEEQDRFYFELDEVPDPGGEGRLELAGEPPRTMSLRPGAVVLLGDVHSVLHGAPPDFNPWPVVHLTLPDQTTVELALQRGTS